MTAFKTSAKWWGEVGGLEGLFQEGEDLDVHYFLGPPGTLSVRVSPDLTVPALRACFINATRL
jgi:hypothetical protein